MVWSFSTATMCNFETLKPPVVLPAKAIPHPPLDLATRWLAVRQKAIPAFAGMTALEEWRGGQERKRPANGKA